MVCILYIMFVLSIVCMRRRKLQLSIFLLFTVPAFRPTPVGSKVLRRASFHGNVEFRATLHSTVHVNVLRA